jgi:hypothetical protein
MTLGMPALIAAIFVFALLGGWLSRMCGGAPPKLPWGLDQWIYGLPYMLISIPVMLSITTIFKWRVNPKQDKYFFAFSGLPYIGAFLGKRTGHGGGMDLGHSRKIREDERLEFFIKPLHGKISEYWYDALLLGVTGIATVLITAIFLCVLNPWAALLILASGAFKAAAYMIGWAIYPNWQGKGIPHLNEATAVGEFLTGFFGYGALGIAAVMVF